MVLFITVFAKRYEIVRSLTTDLTGLQVVYMQFYRSLVCTMCSADCQLCLPADSFKPLRTLA